MHLVDLFLSAFAPSWIAKGSMPSISITCMTVDDRTSGRAGCSGALRAITVGAENARSRVLAGLRVTVVAILFRNLSNGGTVGGVSLWFARQNILCAGAARGLQGGRKKIKKKMHAGYREKERLGNLASNPKKSFRTMLLTGSWSHLRQ